MTISFLTDGVWEDERRIGGGCQDVACLLARFGLAGRLVGCAHAEKGNKNRMLKTKSPAGQKRREPFFLSGGKTPFIPFFLFPLFFSFSDRSINQSSINRHTFASFCGVRGSPGVSKAALNSTVLVGGGLFNQTGHLTNPEKPSLEGKRRDWTDGGLDRTAGAQANLSLVGKHAKMF